MAISADDNAAIDKLRQASKLAGIDLRGARVRRTSSRFCLGVEHGDYNGTELFGIGTDRFVWFAYKPNGLKRMRLFSANFPDDGVVEFEMGSVPVPGIASNADTWARFPFGVDYVLGREELGLTQGIDGVVYGNIPGGGMSRSASLCLNLILSLLDADGLAVEDELKIVDWAQAVENVYIGSPCGQLDQIMILFARAGMGTHYDPSNRSVSYVPLGAGADGFRIMVLDTGTVRPGLEKSTYRIRRVECEELAELLGKNGYDVKCLGDIRDEETYERVLAQFGKSRPHLCARLNYIYHAQQRFYDMLAAWKAGDIATVGAIFRKDGLGLRDDYQISGPELEAMCDIVREVPGVLGERMLGGGDKGASGALVKAEAVKAVEQAVAEQYPKLHPEYENEYAVHVCKPVDGVVMLDEVVI